MRKNDLVDYEDYFDFKRRVRGNRIKIFLDQIEQHLPKALQTEKIKLKLVEDRTYDPEGITVRYEVKLVEAPKELQDYFDSIGPFSLYVKT